MSDLIDQAIFTSVRAGDGGGYHLAAQSPGVVPAEARELAAWGPSHDALSPGARRSQNYFRLTSGRGCVSRTVTAGAEYSARGGPRLWTHFALVPDEVAQRFGRHPPRIWQAVAATNTVDSRGTIPQALPRRRLVGKASLADTTELDLVRRRFTTTEIATLVDTLVREDQVALRGFEGNVELVSCLLDLLPVGCRGEVTFTTGLRFSTGRRVRVTCIADDRDERRRVEREGITVIDRQALATTVTGAWGAWAQLVCQTLSQARIDDWPQTLNRVSATASLDTLNQVADSRGFVGTHV